MIHRLVALHFLTNPKNLSEVSHKDKNKLNNNVENLEWCDHIGIYKTSLLSLSKYKQIQCVETGIIYKSLGDAGRKYNIDTAQLSRVCDKDNRTAKGYHWKSINKLKTS